MFHNYYLHPNISVKNNTNTDSSNIIKPKVKHVKEKRQVIQWILTASVQKGRQLGRGYMIYQSLRVHVRVQMAQKLFKEMELPGIDGKVIGQEIFL